MTTWRFGLFARAAVITAALIVETLLVSFLIQGAPGDGTGGLAGAIHTIQHWVFRFFIAYAASFAILLYLRGTASLAEISRLGWDQPFRPSWAIVHLLLLLPFAALSAILYDPGAALPFWALALLWHSCALAAGVTLIMALAPASVWSRAVHMTGTLPKFALVPALVAVVAIRLSQFLWAPASALTFKLVRLMLLPFCPHLYTDPASLVIGTENFAVTIAEACSGLEGMGLMLTFCTAWLWYFRREYYFPRALVIVPVAVLLVFLLNAARIAALVLIGDAGHQRIAIVGFHSQAGWIAFNLAAFAVAIIARRSPWLNRYAHARVEHTANPTAAYLVPLLVILAAGMVGHAMSAGFDWLYPLRLIAAAAALYLYRDRYFKMLDWRFSARAIGVGVMVFVVWMMYAQFMGPASSMPEALTQMSPTARAGWIACRALAAITTVPIAEELAYRGFLMRRLVSADFETLSFQRVGWPAILATAVIFGVTHGTLWFPGVIAGIAYGVLAVKLNRIGESVVAHATTNLIIVAAVLLFNQWQLW